VDSNPKERLIDVSILEETKSLDFSKVNTIQS
jgi:hypothetical protein